MICNETQRKAATAILEESAKERDRIIDEESAGSFVVPVLLRELQGGFSIVPADDGYVYVSTPFLDKHNDGIGFYLKEIEKNTFRFSDDGYAVGLYMDSGHSQTAAENVARSYGVSVVDGELCATAYAAEVGKVGLMFLNALLNLSF